MTNGPADTTDTKRLVQKVLAQLGQDTQCNWGGRHKWPTSCPKQVHSTERKEIKPSSHTPSRESRRGRSPLTEGWSCSQGEPAQCYHCKDFGYFAKACPSDEFYQIGPNSVQVRTRDLSQDSSQDGRQANDKAPTTKSLN